MAYEYVNIRTDTIDNVKVPTKETLDARTIIESTLEPSDGNGTTVCVYHIGLWQFPKTGLYKIHLTQHGTTSDLFKVFARKTKDDGTLPEDFTQDNLVIQHLAAGDTQVNDLYIQVDYLDNDKLTVYNVKFLTLLQPYNAQVNTYDKTTQKWQFVSATYVQSAKSAGRLAHQLTLTKGDTTTKFDGSTAQTVSIPTKTSELTNDSFVSYAEQTLTEGQQNQAKTNLGIDILTGNTTTVTPTQVKEAIFAGRPVAITYTDTTYGNLTFTSFGYSLENNVVVANLVATSNGQYILADLTGIINTKGWVLQTTELGTSTDIANNYVKYSESQTLTDEQKAQARTNIDAISSSDLVQSDWNQNDTSSPAYIQNRPGGYYSVVNSVNSGTLTTTDFIDLSSEGPGITGYAVQNETLNTALQNLNVTAGKTYKISWIDNDQAFSYISEAVDHVTTEGSVTYHNIVIFGDTIFNLTAAELIWGKTAKVVILDSNSVLTATNTVTSIKIEEVNVVKIPKALVESDNIEEFDLSNNYTATNKGSIKYNYIGTSLHAKETIQSALLGFKNELPQLELFGSMMDTSYKNTTQYLPAGIYSSWVNHSETGDTFIQGMAISHDPNNQLLKLESKLIDNITKDLTVRGIATPTADNDAVNKKYVDDNKSLMCTITGAGTDASPYICDKTYDEILAAVENGRIPYILHPNTTSGGMGDKDVIYFYKSCVNIPTGAYILFSNLLLDGASDSKYKDIKIFWNNNITFDTPTLDIVNSINSKTGSVTLKTSDLENDSNYINTVDTELSTTSENPVQNKVINTALNDKLQYKGNWQSNTTYNKNDVVYDETNMMYVYTETDATSDPPDINPNCQPIINIAINVKKGTLGIPNASIIYSQFKYLIDASTTDSGKYLTVNSEGNPEWGTITAPEESVVIAKLTGAGTTASPYACDKTYNELYTAILAGKYVLMYDNTTKRMLSPYFINIQARLLQFQHVLYEQTGFTTTTSKLTVIAVNYNGGLNNTLTRTVYSSNIVSSVNGKTENVITLSASDVGAASSEDLNTLKNSIPEISVVTLDD